MKLYQGFIITELKQAVKCDDNTRSFKIHESALEPSESTGLTQHKTKKHMELFKLDPEAAQGKVSRDGDLY